MLQTIDQRTLRHAAPAIGRFGKYKKEDDKLVRAPLNKEDTALVQLQEAFRNTEFKGNYLEFIDKNREAVQDAIKGIEYSAYDIEKLSIAFAAFTDIEDFPEKAGYFLSGLINSSAEQDFILRVSHFTHRNIDGKIEGIDFMGLMNTKNITIIGDAAQFIGYGMKKGRITLEGSAYWMIGNDMESGEIIVNGDGGYYAGDHMRGGRLLIRGNAGNSLANGMTGGEVVLFGNSGEEPAKCMKGGRIHIHGNVKGIIQSVDGGEIHVDGEIGRLFGISRQAKIFHKGIRVFPEDVETSKKGWWKGSH